MATDTQKAPSGGDAAAARWVARRDAGLNPAERRELQAWLAADPQHAAAFARADRERTELDWPLHTGTVDDVLAGLERRARQRRTRRRRTLAAAGAVGAVAVLALFNGWRGPVVLPDPTPAAAGSTTLVVMEPLRRTLTDGSTVELKDGAILTTHFDATARRVNLARGTAHFQVVKGTLPFIVQAGGVTAEALGTAFVVEVGAADVSVLVTEGRVAVNRAAETKASSSPGSPPPAPPLAVLDPGKTVSVPIAIATGILAPEVASLPALELEDRLAWRIPRLEFNGTPLVEVVAMINRYNRSQFLIADPSLERLALSGVLRADKVDALVSMLEADFPIVVERRGGELILRPAR